MKYIGKITLLNAIILTIGLNAMERPKLVDALPVQVAMALNTQLIEAAKHGEVNELNLLLGKLGRQANTCDALKQGAQHPKIVMALAEHCCCKKAVAAEAAGFGLGAGVLGITQQKVGALPVTSTGQPRQTALAPETVTAGQAEAAAEEPTEAQWRDLPPGAIRIIREEQPYLYPPSAYEVARDVLTQTN